MGNKYLSTLLAQDSSVKEIQKADLDLLKKINEVAVPVIGTVIYLGTDDTALADQYKGTTWENLTSISINLWRRIS